MPITQAQRKAADKYLKEKYDRLNIRYPKDYIEKIKRKADESGETIAGYVKRAIDNRIEKDEKGKTPD